jgi:glyceraldehyde-3-phosphate dehydrogenase/erythrose-4-phosphate dehydrogenase
MGNIAIHGFNRIGRSTLKAALNRTLFVPLAVADIKDPGTLTALFEVDTNYGSRPEKIIGLVAARYDNEMGYSCRHAETATLLAGGAA